MKGRRGEGQRGGEVVKDETSVHVWRLYKANRTRLVTLEVSLSNSFRSLAFSFSPLSAPLLPNVPSIPHRDLKKKKNPSACGFF